MNRLDRLEFDNEVPFDQQIDAKQAVERRPFVLDRNEDFTRETDISGDEFVLQSSGIGGFQKTGPEVSVHLDGSTYHALCEYVWGDLDVEAWHSFVGLDWWVWLAFFTTELAFFTTELAFFTTELTFFTTELTEEERRATEYCNYLGNDIAQRGPLMGKRSSPKKLQYSVALGFFSVSSVVKKAHYVTEP